MPLSDIYCDHPGCKSRNVKPRFTVALRDISGTKANVRNRFSQPRYYCPKHRRHHRAISPTGGGERARPQFKSYEIVDGKLVPLRGGDVYGQTA